MDQKRTHVSNRSLSGILGIGLVEYPTLALARRGRGAARA
jgi:hypothetical protein